MSTAASPLFLTALTTPRLPEHCTPTSPFLETFSAYTHICIPTPLAFVSCLLGNLSILSWLFAQLPQIIRNYKNQSTSGLSLSFLVEWNLGDLCNLFGALLTNQASWQIAIGAYYVFVDVSLVAQWIWYEWLKHGRPLRRIRLIRGKSYKKGNGDMPELVEPYDSSDQQSIYSADGAAASRGQAVAAQDIPTSKASHAHNMFSTPIYGTMSPSTSLAASPADRTIHRIQQQTLPTASPRAVMFITLMIALAAARASPISAQSHHHESAAVFSLGTILSWTSTFLYLVSRLPQLFMNYRRKSTAGLSPKMFAAAFMGNLFYSSSLACNPSAWQTFGPHGGHGWADHDGSKQAEWVAAAMPFFLGAAGVLALDGAVGLQFWLYGEGPPDHDDSVLMWRDDGAGPGAKEQAMHIRKVSGWMRGWQPTAAGKITPVIRVRRATVAGEEQPLLESEGASEGGSTPRGSSRAVQ